MAGYDQTNMTSQAQMNENGAATPGGSGLTYVAVDENSPNNILDTSKVTTGYFSSGIGTVVGSELHTSSLSTTQKNYYYNLTYGAGGADQLSVTYGAIHGSGSDKAKSSTNIVGETEAIYKQFSSLLIDPADSPLKGYQFSSVTENQMYFIVAERAKMKDRINKKNWTIELSGSDTAGAAKSIWLTDDSSTVQPESTVVGPRYNIVSGTLGTVHTPAATKTYGHFYPNLGIFAIRESEVSSSLGGVPDFVDSGSVGHDLGATVGARDTGLTATQTNNTTVDNAWKMALALRKASGLTLRSEEDQVTKTFFVRAHANRFNFSNNPTFVSGSEHRMTQASFEGNPQVYISTIGLYDANNALVAVGKLSSPIKKNYATETTIKVNLTY